MRLSTLLLAALIGFGSLHVAEAKKNSPKIHYKRPKKTKKFKPAKFKTPKYKKAKKHK
ncbi:MAG TPA: hypothetical protein VLX58_09730 [Bryobacteraceae bacterium]|nr:hypothetical protein [Bryobacteraceae bacterium]